MTAQSAAPRPVYAVLGEDPFLRRQAVDRILDLALRDDPGALGPTRIDGDTAELADALDELQTYSLLGGRRVVIVEDADGFITRYRKQLEKYCSAPTEDATLVLLCRSMPRNTRLYKIIAEKGDISVCTPPRGRETVNWISQRARQEHQVAIDQQAVARLRELIGDHLEALDGELAKLSLYVADRKRVTVEDVEALVGLHREEAVFRVTDAMANGDVAGALKAWEHVLATDRAAPMRAIGGLGAAIRRLLAARQAIDSGASAQSVAASAGAFRNQFLRQVQATNANALQRQLEDLYQADLRSKTGLADVDKEIEVFIVKHTENRRRPARMPVGG